MMPRSHKQNLLGLPSDSLEERVLLSASIVQPVLNQPLQNQASLDPRAPKLAKSIQSSMSQEIRGRSTMLRVLGSDDQGEVRLTYTWTVETTPVGGNATFQSNSSNRAKNTMVRFDRAGDYSLRVDITDRDGKTTSERVQLRVVPVMTSFSITSSDIQTARGPASGVVRTASPTFQVQARDQFGNAIATASGVTWRLEIAPGGSKPTVQPQNDSVSIQLDRAGTYRLRATSGRFSAVTRFDAIPTLSRVDLLVNGQSIPSGQTLRITSSDQRITVQGFDQFGNKWNRTVEWAWNGTSGTSGASPQIKSNGSQANIKFGGPGNYQISVQSAGLTRTLALEVASPNSGGGTTNNTTITTNNNNNTNTATNTNTSTTTNQKNNQQNGTTENNPIATGREVRVANGAELRIALRNAQAGDIILLRSGVNYGPLNLYKPTRRFDGMVTVRSENPLDRATFDWINFMDVENLTLEGVNVGNLSRFAAVTITNSKNIVIRDSQVTSNHDPYLPGQALRRGVDLRQSENVLFDRNVFERLGTAFGVKNSSHLVIQNNLFKENLLDNLNLGSNISDVLVRGNTLHAQVAKLSPTHHYDNIQLWVQTDATQNSKNITITENTIYDLTGAVNTQAIFGRGDYNDANGVPNPYGFENIEISHNVIVSQHKHGISLTDANGIRILNNTLVYGGDYKSKPRGVHIPSINITKSTSVEISGNILPGRKDFKQLGPDFMTRNTFYMIGSGDLAQILVNPHASNPTRHDFATTAQRIGPDGSVSFHGAELANQQTDRPSSTISYDRKLVDGRFLYTFDANASLPTLGLDLRDAKYTWRFSDGSVVEGPRVERFLESKSPQNVRLTVVDRLGRTHSTLKERIGVPDANVIALSFDGSVSDLTDNPSVIVSTGAPRFIREEHNKSAIELGGDSGHLYISPADPDLIEMQRTKQLTISTRILAQKNENKRSITLFGVYKSWGASIALDGTIRLSVGGTAQSFKPPSDLLNGEWNELSLVVKEGNASFFVNGVRSFSTTLSPIQQELFFRDNEYGISIGFGRPWIENVKYRYDNRFFLDNLFIGTAALSDAQIAAMALRNTLV